MSQLQQQLAEAHAAAQQAARDAGAATEASREASAALAAAEAARTQLQQQLGAVQGQVHSKGSELALLRECMETCKSSLQQQVAGLQAELQQQRSRSEELQGRCDQAACGRERELAQVGPVNGANAIKVWTFPASSGATCLVCPDRLCLVNSHGRASTSLPGTSAVPQPEQALPVLPLAGTAGGQRAAEGAHSCTVTAAAGSESGPAGG